MNKSFRKDRENQPSRAVYNQAEKARRHQHLPDANKRSLRLNRPRNAGSLFPSLAELPLLIWLLLIIILLLFLTNHPAVSDLIQLLTLIKAW